MTMKDELGSIMSHFYTNNPCKVYMEVVPQDFQVPCMYMPPPITSSRPFTSSSHEKMYILSIKVYDQTSQGAFEKAESIADAIRTKRFCIPLINEQGEALNRRIYFTSIENRIIEVDSKYSIAEVSLQWNSRYNFEQQSWPKMGYIEFTFEYPIN